MDQRPGFTQRVQALKPIIEPQTTLVIPDLNFSLLICETSYAKPL